ncbi:MAG: hypothetical protein IKU31_03935 [Oscillospiraceae bacterium]|nr:hypothetical protein [Oscillospiraceae bacterium]
MDSQVLSTFITTGGAIITALIGYLVSLLARPKKEKITISEMQMRRLFEPLVTLLDFREPNDLVQLLSSIEELFKKEYLLLPGQYMDEYQKLVVVENLTWEDFQPIRKLAKFDLEATRMMCGYPNSFRKEKGIGIASISTNLKMHLLRIAATEIATIGVCMSLGLLLAGVLTYLCNWEIGYQLTKQRFWLSMILLIFSSFYLLGLEIKKK